MTRKYGSPPLVEAICEFRFATTQPQDWTIPGLLYEAIRSEFPTKEQIGVVQVTVDAAGGQIAQQAQPQMRFASVDKTEFVQVAPGVVSVHQVRPYKGWAHFKGRILRILDAYRSIGTIEGVARIGLRYINRIELPPGQHELGDYFRVMPQAPAPIPQVFQAFVEQIQILYGREAAAGNPDSSLRLTFATVVPETSPGHNAYVLDLDMATPDNAAPDIESVAGWLETVHGRVEEAFDAAFTPTAHAELFHEVPA